MDTIKEHLQQLHSYFAKSSNKTEVLKAASATLGLQYLKVKVRLCITFLHLATLVSSCLPTASTLKINAFCRKWKMFAGCPSTWPWLIFSETSAQYWLRWTGVQLLRALTLSVPCTGRPTCIIDSGLKTVFEWSTMWLLKPVFYCQLMYHCGVTNFSNSQICGSTLPAGGRAATPDAAFKSIPKGGCKLPGHKRAGTFFSIFMFKRANVSV